MSTYLQSITLPLTLQQSYIGRGGEELVYGANTACRHGAGAAKTARDYYGASVHQCKAAVGKSYGIATKDDNLQVRGLSDIAGEASEFLSYSSQAVERVFLLSAVGTGLAGYSHEQMAPLFDKSPWNVIIPWEWLGMANNPVGGEQAVVHQFDTSLELGNKAAAIVKAHMESKGRKIQSVEDDPEYRRRGIDFLMTLPSGKVVTLEVKGDTHRKNIFLETISVAIGGISTPGWATYTHADYVAYYFFNDNRIYWLPGPSLVHFTNHSLPVFANDEWFKVVLNFSRTGSGVITESRGYAVDRDNYIRWMEHDYGVKVSVERL